MRHRAPDTLYEHHANFRRLIRYMGDEADWKSCVIYFSEKWVNAIRHDPAWAKIKSYLHAQVWGLFSYYRNRNMFDLAVSTMQSETRYKPDPYHLDTAKHIVGMASGSLPGFIPLLNNQGAPISALQHLYVDIYDCYPFVPVILGPTLYDYEKDPSVYYSFKYPTTSVFFPSRRATCNRIERQREAEYIFKRFKRYFNREDAIGRDSRLAYVARNLEVKYLHREVDTEGLTMCSDELPKIDRRFAAYEQPYALKRMKTSKYALFTVGGLQIKVKKPKKSEG